MRIAIKWGIILGVAVCLWTLALHALGFYTTNLGAGQTADQVAFVLPIAAIVFALLELRRARGTGLSIKESLLTGVMVGIISAVITVPFLWIYHRYMNPQWLDLLVDYQTKRMIAAGRTSEQISAAVTTQRTAGTPGAQILAGFVGSILVSLVLAFIIGLFYDGRRVRRRTATYCDGEIDCFEFFAGLRSRSSRTYPNAFRLRFSSDVLRSATVVALAESSATRTLALPCHTQTTSVGQRESSTTCTNSILTGDSAMRRSLPSPSSKSSSGRTHCTQGPPARVTFPRARGPHALTNTADAMTTNA